MGKDWVSIRRVRSDVAFPRSGHRGKRHVDKHSRLVRPPRLPGQMLGRPDLRVSTIVSTPMCVCVCVSVRCSKKEKRESITGPRREGRGLTHNAERVQTKRSRSLRRTLGKAMWIAIRWEFSSSPAERHAKFQLSTSQFLGYQAIRLIEECPTDLSDTAEPPAPQSNMELKAFPTFRGSIHNSGAHPHRSCKDR